MKKIIITLSLLLGLTMTTFADGGLFQRGYNAKNGFSGYNYFGARDMGDEEEVFISPLMPMHNLETDQDAPIGSGIIVLMGLGAAYLVGKKRREE